MDTNLQESMYRNVVADILNALPIFFQQPACLHADSFLLWAPDGELSRNMNAGPCSARSQDSQSEVLWS